MLLAEANIPHQLVKEMVCVLDGLGKYVFIVGSRHFERGVFQEEINDDFKKADMTLVCGANDIVNSDASRVGSPIYGMPVLRYAHGLTDCIIYERLKFHYILFNFTVYGNQKRLLSSNVARLAVDMHRLKTPCFTMLIHACALLIWLRA